MNTPTLTYSDTQLPVVQQFADGSWVYYFDRNVHEEEREFINDNNIKNAKTVYTAISVKFNYEKPNYKQAVDKVIRLYLSSSEEFDLINSAYQGDDTKYKEWLSKLTDIKTKINADFDKE